MTGVTAAIGDQQWKDNLDRFGETFNTYHGYIKEVCMGCGTHIRFDIKRYEQRGNCCGKCDQKINMKVLTKSALKNYYGRKLKKR